jgi:hypothetical protein
MGSSVLSLSSSSLHYVLNCSKKTSKKKTMRESSLVVIFKTTNDNNALEHFLILLLFALCIELQQTKQNKTNK